MISLDLYKIRQELNKGIPLTDLNLKVTAYARVSTDSIEQKKSLQNQKEYFYKYINDNKKWFYVESYIDEGITGTSDVKRDSFMKMIDDAKKGLFDLIVTKEISRFSRNTLDSIKYTRELLSYGVAVLFINDNINTVLPDSELRLTIMASMAQDEVRRLSERVKFGMNQAIKRGEILGNNKLYGYNKNFSLKVLEKNLEEEKIVQRIFYQYGVLKYSLSKITKLLNQENIKTSFGNKWSVVTISRMISNPKYKGFYCGKKSEVVDYMSKKVNYFNDLDWITYEDPKRIPSIVTEELWNLANERLKSRKKKQGKKETYLLSAKIWCKNHGTIFYPRKFRKVNSDVTWVCKEYLNHGKKYCDTANIRETELQEIIFDFSKLLKINFDKIFSLLLTSYLSTINEDSDDVEKFRKQIQLKKDKILDLNINGYLSDMEFKNKNEELNNLLKIKDKEYFKSDEKIKKKKEELRNEIRKRIDSSDLINKCMMELVKKIEVEKIKEIIYLNIIFSNNSKKEILKTYSFQRGDDSIKTKKYDVVYEVKYLY